MRILAWLSLLCCAVQAATAQAACSRTMRVGWTDFPPYTQAAPEGAPAGIEADMVRAIFRKAGCSVEFIADVPTKRQALYLQTGEIDMQLAASDIKERHAYAWYSLPYRREVVALFVRKGELGKYPIKRLGELATGDWRVLVPYQGWYGQAFSEILPQLREHRTAYPYVSSSQAVEMLYHQRAELLVGDYFSMRYTARQEGLPEPDALPVPVNDNGVHLIFSKRTVTREDVATIDAAIQKLDAEGELRRIAERYLAAGPGEHHK